jgi:hypothetical protein
MAFISGQGEPGNTDWQASSWSGTTSVNGYYQAQCLVGPTGGVIAPAQGLYTVWVKIFNSPEFPVQAVGSLTITP